MIRLDVDVGGTAVRTADFLRPAFLDEPFLRCLVVGEPLEETLNRKAVSEVLSRCLVSHYILLTYKTILHESSTGVNTFLELSYIIPLLNGWANYFSLGQVSPAYATIDRHATRRLRQWLSRKHKVRAGKTVRFPDKRLWKEWELTRLGPRTASFPWARV